MREVTASTTITVSKRELVQDGTGHHSAVYKAVYLLQEKIHRDLVNMILSDLKDVDNNFQFELTIKKLENSEI